MDDETVQRVSELLHEAAETHHRVFRIVDGDDADWATWYAQWLIDLSELPQLLGHTPVRSHLIHDLVSLDREYVLAPRGEGWERFYARALVGTSQRVST